ncbi:MAG: class I SAM-dependent methyltransferase [Bacillati bacterium ANGP1]|uniref:Class I SAM-dependent methyltransferase n=1 Tax=Candidatus Segetimicrobium genomatis TaxID=2569760 RepID=A0A537IW48_9BACT|nr:MAG: class I SAM-dependent methyltransferase [Terrabacteria group bacterium ANGP1]
MAAEMKMDDNLRDRVNREKAAYDVGDVWEKCHRLHSRFWHVSWCPNSLFGEACFWQIVDGNVPGRIVLDCGCYNGTITEELLSRHPQKVVGIDISKRAIAEAKTRFGSRAEFRVMDAHRMEFPDDSFDFVVGRAILHHLDYEIAIREIRRVLKPGGRALFMEPLRDNPAAKLFRFLTPRAHTKDELPLSRHQILWADRVMGAGDHMFVNLFSVPVGILTSLFIKLPDNFFTRAADRVDRWVASRQIRYWMRQVILVWRKAG